MSQFLCIPYPPSKWATSTSSTFTFTLPLSGCELYVGHTSILTHRLWAIRGNHTWITVSIVQHPLRLIMMHDPTTIFIETAAHDINIPNITPAYSLGNGRTVCSKPCRLRMNVSITNPSVYNRGSTVVCILAECTMAST